MSSSRPSSPRRQALKQLLVGAGALAAWPLRAQDGDLPHLSEKDPQARKLGYVEDAAHVDAKTFAGFEPAQRCENCMQLQGTEGAAFRPCQLFAGKLVAAKGWCSSWTPEI